MILQSFIAAAKAVAEGIVLLIGLWPSTPRGRRDIAVGDDVLLRVSAAQERGIPGRVMEIDPIDGSYTVRWLDGTFKGVLKGRLLKFKLEVGDEVLCVHGKGLLVSMSKDECAVDVSGTVYKVERLAVLPSTEPHTGFDRNPTVELMIRKCGFKFVHLDFLPGAAREGACVTLSNHQQIITPPINIKI